MAAAAQVSLGGPQASSVGSATVSAPSGLGPVNSLAMGLNAASMGAPTAAAATISVATTAATIPSSATSSSTRGSAASSGQAQSQALAFYFSALRTVVSFSEGNSISEIEMIVQFCAM